MRLLQHREGVVDLDKAVAQWPHRIRWWTNHILYKMPSGYFLRVRRPDCEIGPTGHEWIEGWEAARWLVSRGHALPEDLRCNIES